MLRPLRQAPSLGWCWLGLLTSCSVAYEYPSSKAETSAMDCANGTDDDFDGLIDCDDPSCDGFCPEDSEARCADGRDNDGDGLIDARDARCWHLSAPEVVRCASSEPMDFEERFDGSISSARWFAFGQAPRLEAPVSRSPRPDGVLGFAPEWQEEAGLSSLLSMEGSGGALELAFQARVEAGSRLSVALVPIGLAPSNAAPTEGALSSSVAIQLAGTSVGLLTDGVVRKTSLEDSNAWHVYRLSAIDETLALSVGGTRLLEARRPDLAAFRIVVIGFAAQEGSAQVDDIRVRVPALRPCGVVAPQMPLGASCALDSGSLDRNVGLTLSAAARDDGNFCALLTEAPVGGEKANRVQSWRSEDGLKWQFGGALSEAEEGEEVVGAAVAYDAETSSFRAVVTLRDGQGARLEVFESEDCGSWTGAADGVALPGNAQAPSYLIPGVLARNEVYFTRADEEGRGVALWRMRSDDGYTFLLDDEPVTVFGPDDQVEAPLALTRAGPRDVILTHRIALSSSVFGLGLWVARDDTLSDWARTARWPLIQSEPARGGFDALGIVSGAVVWTGGSGYLLYGGLGAPLPEIVFQPEMPRLTVGTALLIENGHPPPETQATDLPGLCGDGVCDPFESCDVCPVECGACDGEVLMTADFTSEKGWQREPDTNSAAPAIYVSDVAQRVNVSKGERAWLVHALDTPVLGDFELTFDAHWAAPEPGEEGQSCAAFVGVGTLPEEGSLEAEGAFAQLDQLACGAGAPAFSALVRTADQSFRSLTGDAGAASTSCLGAVRGIPESWHRVVMRRRNGKVSVQVTGRDSCADSIRGVASIHYTGALQSLDKLLIGWGPSDLASSCTTEGAALTIDNIVLQSLPCPSKGRECVHPDSGAKVCVDVSLSNEHCGTCFEPVESAERCEGGSATCGGALCPFKGALVCTALDTSPLHCGSCGRAVRPLEVCASGYPRSAMVRLPGRYSIDATEVSRSQYADWLATDPVVEAQPEVCAWNESYQPACAWPPGEYPDQPVVCVDWCDARAYCEAVGKRLCGDVLGGSISPSDATADGQWYLACSSGGINKYVSGEEYDPIACNGKGQLMPGTPLLCAAAWEIGSEPSCQSAVLGFEGVFDLNGNADEWIDACAAQGKPREQLCLTAGGSGCSFLLGKECSRMESRRRDETSADVGFRCCSR